MTQALALKLLLVKVPCPGEFHHLPPEHRLKDKTCCLAYGSAAPLPECDAANKVWRLDPEDKLGLRVKCPGYGLDTGLIRKCYAGKVSSVSGGSDTVSEMEVCGVCQGRGWTLGGWEAFHNATLALPGVLEVSYTLAGITILGLVGHNPTPVTLGESTSTGLPGLLRAVEKICLGKEKHGN